MASHERAVEWSGGVEKSVSDHRELRHVVLENGLEALLVRDPEAERAAAAMDVNVGHFSDPEEIPGLAHFLEHMLFLGTEKFPDENSYSAFLSENGGKSNAYTSMENTNYQFDVSAGSLEGALDRFAQFFIAPLFTPGATDRELNAVDSEHSKNIQDDMWRSFQLEKTTSNPAHPYHKFATGDSKTLRDVPKSKGIDVRQSLLDFHERYYSANRMKLVVLGRDSLDQLEEWTRAYFGPIPNTGVGPPSYGPGDEVLPLTREEEGRQIEVVPVKDLRSVELTWALPSLRDQYQQGPARYVSNLVGHEGPGSVLAALKALGWANELHAGLSFNTSNFSFFKVSIDCTVEGIKHTEAILAVVFAYLDMIRKEDYSGVHEWLWEEIATQTANSFQFQSKPEPFSFVSRASARMQIYPKEHILSANLLRKFDRRGIQQVLDVFVPERAQIMLMHKGVEEQRAGELEEETWYKTKYAISKLDAALLERWSEDPLSVAKEDLGEDASKLPALHLPEPNEYLPTDFAIADFVQPEAVSTKALVKKYPEINPLLHNAVESMQSVLTWQPSASVDASDDSTDQKKERQKEHQQRRKALRNLVERSALSPWAGDSSNAASKEVDTWRPPVLLAAGDDVGGLLWFKQDAVFLRPKAVFSVLIQSPVAYADPAAAVLSELYTMLVQDMLTEVAYAAEIAGLFYQFRNLTSGIVLTVGGFSHKLEKLLLHIAGVLTDPEAISAREFERFKERLTDDYKNFEKEQAYQHAMYTCSLLINTPRWHIDEKLAAIGALSRDDLVAHIKELLRNCSLETATQGNFTPAQALDQAKMLRAKFGAMSAETLCDPIQYPRVISLEPRSETHYLMVGRDPDNNNSAVEVVFQVGPGDPHTRALLQLLAQLAQEPAFNYLRTEEQLGYIVFCGVRSDQGICALRVIVQSNRADPLAIDQKVEIFLDKLEALVDGIEEATLQQNIEAVLDNLLEKDKNVFAEARRWSNEIESHFYRFSRATELAACVAALSKVELQDFFRSCIHRDGPGRRKLLVGVFGSEHVSALPDPAAASAPDSAVTRTASPASPQVLVDTPIRDFRAAHTLFPVQQTLPAQNKL